MADRDVPLEISPATLAAWLAAPSPPLVVDVREPWEVGICALPGSLNVPLGELPARLAELPSDRRLVLLCHHGMRSMQATAWLRRQGRDAATNLAGGIDAWAETVEPGMARY